MSAWRVNRTWREDDEVDHGDTGLGGGARQHGEDGRVQVVEADRVDCAVVAQIVLVGAEVAVPGDHVVRRVGHAEVEHLVLELVHHLVRRNGVVGVLEPRDWALEVTRIGQSVGADGAEVGQLEVSLEDLDDVTAAALLRRALRGLAHVHGELDTTGDDENLAGGDLESTHLRLNLQGTLLGHNQEVSIRVEEGLVVHVSIKGVVVDRASRLHGRIA